MCVFATQYLSIVASLCVPLTFLSDSQWVFGYVDCSHSISLLYAAVPSSPSLFSGHLGHVHSTQVCVYCTCEYCFNTQWEEFIFVYVLYVCASMNFVQAKDFGFIFR